MMITHKKLQPLQCYHIFSESRDVYLTKNCYEHYSPRMVPVAELSGSGSWPNTPSPYPEGVEESRRRGSCILFINLRFSML